MYPGSPSGKLLIDNDLRKCSVDRVSMNLLLQDANGFKLVKVSKKGHDHGTDEQEILRRSAIVRMKERVIAQPEMSCREVYREVLACFSEEHLPQRDLRELASSLPTFSNVRTSLQRSRATIRPKLPACLSELTIEGEWTLTCSGQQFLQIDDGREDRIVGFFTDDTLKILCESRIVLMDGTFRVVPDIFSQLYTIHGEFLGQIMPLCYLLLPKKDRETYLRMFTLIQNCARSRGLLVRPGRCLD